MIFRDYGQLSYAIIFLIIFCESGVLLTAILPGNVLLFVCGMLSAQGIADTYPLIMVILIGSWLGNVFNYSIGRWVGKRWIQDPNFNLISADRLEETRVFFDKYGNKAVFFCRFVPYIHIIVPFIAGTMEMDRREFIGYAFSAVSIWVLLFFGTGYFLGNIPWVADNFTQIIVVMVVAGFIPVLSTYFKKKWSS